MKKQIMYLCLSSVMLSNVLISCTSDDIPPVNPDAEYNWTTDGGLKACSNILFTNGKEDNKGVEIGNGDQEFVFTGKQTLKKGIYTLKGWVYIAKGAELTIEPGTIIKGDKNTKASLIAERGGKLIAKGTQTEPIIFTSSQAKGQRKPGDWGGLILCGNAQNNQIEMQIEGGPRTKHGGIDNNDNSGTLSYVRIEFAGYPFQKDKEINGLTFASVGKGTQVDHVQVSYSNDDSFEFFGGNVNCKYLVAYRGWDDDFDTDNGYSGNVQFGLSVRDDKIADTSMSNGFESDNCADGSALMPFTSATFSNITLIGPNINSNFTNTTDYINGGNLNPNNGSATGLFQSAIQIRRYSKLNCQNSVAIGFPIGILLDNQKGNTQGAAKNKELKLKHIYFAGMGVTGSDANKVFDDYLVTGYDESSKPIIDKTQKSFSSTWFLSQEGNKVFTTIGEIMISNLGIPMVGSPVLNVASFNGLDPWFTPVSYIGAFGLSQNWTENWTNFDPQNTDY